MLKLHDFCNRARYSIGVGVTGFELDFWGRVRNPSDAARSQYLATVQAERAFRLALIRDVASTYFASREADERIALAEATVRSEEHTSELQSLMRISYAVFCLKKKKLQTTTDIYEKSL